VALNGGRPAAAGARPAPAGQPAAAHDSHVRPGRAAQPAALLYGPGHRIVHANAAFTSEFGIVPIGVPASEALVDLPPIVFEIVDRVIASGRPLAAWVEIRGARRRLTVAPRTDVETGEVYGVALGLATP
jgi:hypothetical protein